MDRFYIYYSINNYLVETCKCSDLVDTNGYGACRKRDPRIGSLFSCYVDSDSGCKDLVATNKTEYAFLSAIACEDENEGLV